MATFSLVLTEVFSAVHLLSRLPVFTAWVLFTVVPVGILIARRQRLSWGDELHSFREYL
jgi:hypothetical protein